MGGGARNVPTKAVNGAAQGAIDKRIRIRAPAGQQNTIYGDPNNATNPMRLLHETNGLVFPFTPTITYSQNPNWATQELTHTIQQYYYFTSTNSAEINITGEFTVQNPREGQYLLAVFHFLRSYSKMHFGEKEPQQSRGLPPPILQLDGYGDYMFNSLPILIRSWSMDMLKDVDYVEVPVNSQLPQPITDPSELTAITTRETTSPMSADLVGVAYLPAYTNISINAIVQQPPVKLRKEFSLTAFRNGELLGKKNKGFT